MERTPERWADYLIEACAVDEVKPTCFSEEFYSDSYGRTGQMIVQGPIPIYSICEHHILPFYGHAWIGYIPSTEPTKITKVYSRKVIGLSKLARIAVQCSKGFNTQERITQRIAQTIAGLPDLEPVGVGVAVRCEHMCMACRGVGLPNVFTLTQELTGPFFDQAMTRSEFFNRVDSLKP